MAQFVWLVTGCSSGFGEQLTLDILARGDKVIATARNIDKIRHLEDAGASILQLDVTSDITTIQSAVQKAVDVYGRIDVLVNNAAYVQIGLVEDLSYEQYLSQFETNFFGTIKVTQAVLPHLRSRKQGTIVLLSSLSGQIGHPGTSAYASSKFALEGLAESLRSEVAAFGIKVLLLEPGRFRTKLLASGNVQMQASQISDYMEFSNVLLGAIAAESGKQPGDPKKLVSVLLDLVRGEGIAKDRGVPFRLPLGSDCLDEVSKKVDQTRSVMEEWKDVVLSTDFED